MKFFKTPFVGISPERKLEETFKKVSLNSDPIELGMLPVSPLLDKSNTARSLRFPSSVGILPVRKFPRRYNCRNDVQLPSSFGMGP